MARKTYSNEDIFRLLREIELHLASGLGVATACQAARVALSTMHYQPAPQNDDALRLALIQLAKQYGRYG